jgi:hypothetical protein
MAEVDCSGVELAGERHADLLDVEERQQLHCRRGGITWRGALMRAVAELADQLAATIESTR